MEKEESFVIMGCMLGALLLVVVAISLIIKPTKAEVVDREVVKDTPVEKKKEKEEKEKTVDTKEYTPISINQSRESINTKFIVEMDESGMKGKELFYKTSYSNFYLLEGSSSFVNIKINGQTYSLNDALNNKIISIYDFMEKMGSLVTEEDRFMISYSEDISETFDLGTYKLIYKNGHQIKINKDNNGKMNLEEMLKGNFSKMDFVNLLRYETGQGDMKAYKLADGESYMFESGLVRIFVCNSTNKNIYVGPSTMNFNCD